jgi:hypothetical protein
MPAAPASAARATAVRAAQQAFFRAALSGEPAAAPAAPQPAPTAATKTTPEAQPQRYARPGSLVDIKV